MVRKGESFPLSGTPSVFPLALSLASLDAKGSRAEKPQGRKISFSRQRSFQKFSVLAPHMSALWISVKGWPLDNPPL